MIWANKYNSFEKDVIEIVADAIELSMYYGMITMRMRMV